MGLRHIPLLALVACTSARTVTITIPPPRATDRTENACASARGACAKVVVHDDMGSYFALDHATASIDGRPFFDGPTLPSPAATLGLVPVTPGAHELVVELTYHFVSHCFYCYVRAYRFDVRSRHAFTAKRGEAIEIEAFAYEKGGVTTPIEERPAMRFVERVRKP